MIFAEAFGGRADGPNPPRGQIVPSADKINNAILEWIEKKTVDGEIAAAGVFLGGSEANAAGSAAVFIVSIGAESRHFHDAAAAADEDDAKGRADGLCGGE